MSIISNSGNNFPSKIIPTSDKLKLFCDKPTFEAFNNLEPWIVPVLYGYSLYASQNDKNNEMTDRVLDFYYRNNPIVESTYDSKTERNFLNRFHHSDMKYATDSMLWWEQAKTFEEAQYLMLCFLSLKNGPFAPKDPSMIQNPWHSGPVETETIPLLDKLREINRRGFVTVEGQPGTCTKLRSIFSNNIVTEKQRGYMSGMILNNKVKKFVQRLKQTGKVIIYTEKLDGIEMFGFDQKLLRDITTKKGTRKVLNLTMNEEKSEIDYYTNHFVTESSGVNFLLDIEPYNSLTENIKSRATFVKVITKEYCDTSLDSIVLSCLDNVEYPKPIEINNRINYTKNPEDPELSSFPMNTPDSRIPELPKSSLITRHI